jgi:hypothetical protein
MRAKFFKLALVAVLVLGLGSLAVSRLSPVGRVSAAFPLPPQLIATRNDALIALPWSRKLPFLLELHRRMERRALTCTKDQLPSWAAPLDEVINNMPNPNCFIDVDKDLSRWVGFVRLGPMLRQPPLRPVPAAAAKRLTDKTILQGAHFPARAGVVLLEKAEEVLVVEIATNKSLLSIKKGQSWVGRLSPNGRVFLLEDWRGSHAVETETGETVAELPGVYRRNFFWIDERMAVLGPRNDESAVVLDFDTGRELPLPGQTRPIEAVAPVPDAPDQFVVGYARASSKFQLVRSKAQITRLTTRGTEIDWDHDNDGVTADGRYYVAADGAIAILDLQTMEQKSVALGLFHAQQVIPTHNPKWVVLRGTVPFEPHIKTRCYLYDLRDNTLAPLKCGETSARQPLYFAPMKQYGTIDRYGIEPAELPYTTARTVDEQVLAWMDEDAAEQQRLAEIDELVRRTRLEAQETWARHEADMQRQLREMEQSAYQIRDPARRQEMLNLLRSHMRR